MNLGRATLVLGCLMLLTAVGVIVKLALDDIGKKDTCPYCSAPLTPKVRICPRCRTALGKR